MITRGTTPYHSFIIPIAADQIKTVYITYLQNNEIIFDKDNEDIEIKPVILDTENADTDGEEDDYLVAYSQLTTHLTQEDTLSFRFYPAAEKNIAVIQIRILDVNDEAYASEPIRERIFGVLKDGVLE